MWRGVGREGGSRKWLYSGPLGGVDWGRRSGSLCEKWLWAYIMMAGKGRTERGISDAWVITGHAYMPAEND